MFVRSGASWSLQARLKASNAGAFDGFGAAVAVSGDTVVVGAPGEDGAGTGVNGDQANNSAEDAGAAYVFVRTGTTWSQQAYLKASNAEARDEFGVSVAVAGDTVVVGARQEDSRATGVNGNQQDNSAEQQGRRMCSCAAADVEPAGVPQGLQRRLRERRVRCERSRSRATRSWSGRQVRTVMPRG